MKMKQLMTYGFAFALALVFSHFAAAVCVEQYDRLKPDHLYSVDVNGNVTDGETGLVWHRCPMGATWNNGAGTCDGSALPLTWHAALNVAANAAATTFAGETDWRLPNKKELASLMDKSCKSPAINTVFFPQRADVGRLWSATVKIGSNKTAWAINYAIGDDILVYKTGLASVYLVRN